MGPGTWAQGDLRFWHEGTRTSPYPGVLSALPFLPPICLPIQPELFPINKTESLVPLQDFATVKKGGSFAFGLPGSEGAEDTCVEAVTKQAAAPWSPDPKSRQSLQASEKPLIHKDR